MNLPARVSHYELLQRIGRDGASEIYRGRDQRLERDVAVKLLRPEETARPHALERFRREARTASLVTHPHICTVHDSGEENGQPFLVLELLEGKALDEVMASERLPLDRALDVAIQIADALSAAHRRGIVHGNVKPSNVFMTTDEHAKLLELGAASAASSGSDRAVRSTGSHTGSATLPVAAGSDGEFFHAYLSPEQVGGAPATERSDIFSTGAVLYQMTTGISPFAGKSARDFANAILTRTPEAPRSLIPTLPAPVEAIIQRALQKDPSQRYASASELLEDLRRARRALDISPRLTERIRHNHRVRQAIFAASIVLAVVALTAAARWWMNGAAGAAERNTVLVSHIANGTADPDFDGTLRQAITVYLAQSPYLELASDERISSTLRMMGKPSDTRMTHDVAAEVCQRLGFQALLEGTVSAMGKNTVVALVATDCSSGSPIAREQVEVERKEDVLKAMGRLTATMRSALGESSATLSSHNVPIEEATTPSLEALKAYTEATARRAAGAEVVAVKLLERAIEIDPKFALAYTTLSSIYGGFGETGRSEEYARLAYEHRDRVSERERIFIVHQYHDRVTGDQLKAREALEVWKRTYPRDYRGPNALAVLLNRLGDYVQAALEAEEAMRRNPEHAFPRSNLAHALRGAGRYDEARRIIDEAMARNLETTPMRRLLYQLAVIQGDDATARKQIEWASTHTRLFDLTGARGQVAAFGGRLHEARALFGETMKLATHHGFPQVASGYAAQLALLEALYGNRREAVEHARSVMSATTPYEPQVRALTAMALSGDVAEAEPLVQRLRSVRLEDTLLHGAYLPAAQAAILVTTGRADDAIEQLRRASPYERGFVAALLPIYLRAEANLRAEAYDDAAQEYRRVIDNRGADPFSPLLPMSHLGLARALAKSGKTADARRAYDELFRIWHGADADLPVLTRARAEAAALR